MNRPPAASLAIEAAEALCAWDGAYQRGVQGTELRRLRLTYYDLRWRLERRFEWYIAARLASTAPGLQAMRFEARPVGTSHEKATST